MSRGCATRFSDGSVCSPELAKYACTSCGKDLMFALPQEIFRWKSPTDDRIFCSTNCIAQSKAPVDVNLEYDL